MNKSLFFLLSLIVMPCFGERIQVLLEARTTDGLLRPIIGEYDTEKKQVSSLFADADSCANYYLSVDQAHLIDERIEDKDKNFVAIKKLDQEVSVNTDAATLDLLQSIMANPQYNLAPFDQPTTVKLLNELIYTNIPTVLRDQLIAHCVDLFIQHPHELCPFGVCANIADSDNPALFIPGRFVQQARADLYNRFKQHVLPHCQRWQIVAMLQHPKATLSATYSPDGQHILTVCNDNNIRIWDTNGTLLKKLRHPDSVWAATFSPDGQHILTTCYDNNVRIWDTNGILLQKRHRPNEPYSARYSPDGQHILTACTDHNAYLWDTNNGNHLQTLHHPDLVLEATFSHDGQHILTVCRDHNVYLWDTNNGNHLQTLHHAIEVFSATFSPDGQHTLTAGYDNNVRIWHPNGTLLQTLYHPSRFVSATYSPNGQHILTACYDHNVRIWDINGTLLQTLQHPDEVQSTTYSPDNQYILTSCHDHNVRIWDTNGTHLHTLPHPSGFISATYSPDGQHILTVCHDKNVRIWQMAWAPQFSSILDLSETELRRIAFMTRVATNPQLSAQEIANLQPIYQNLPADQRAWVDQQTHNVFLRLTYFKNGVYYE